ncbi:HTH domain-containing protein [Carnobacterium pleistocenium]|uniref:HTH domain-containing protein n=1 Tax=Carnobacterium pleistocenium TaxID=181073 RepID=UPI0006922301|nr:HTH domain-containing protein [Carnobacterium pleistocenium]
MLKVNPYVKNVSEKSITYTDEFKRHFISESLGLKTAKQLFIEAGFDPEMIGESRMKSFASRPRKTALTLEQQIEKLQAKILLLGAENDLLKKSEWSERRPEKSEKTSNIFSRIHEMRTEGSYTGTLVNACKALSASRSGYYNYLKGLDSRNARDEEDQVWRMQIEKVITTVVTRKVLEAL